MNTILIILGLAISWLLIPLLAVWGVELIFDMEINYTIEMWFGLVLLRGYFLDTTIEIK